MTLAPRRKATNVARILNSKRLQQRLKALRLKSRKKNNGSVIVGYTANYAVYVHENKEAHHPNGQAKFLEQPFREKADEIAKIAQKTAEATGSIVDGLVVGGLFLQRESQKLVPVDTGNLKGSAFTRKE